MPAANDFGSIAYLPAGAARTPRGLPCGALLGKAAAATEPDASPKPLEACAARPIPLLRE